MFPFLQPLSALGLPLLLRSLQRSEPRIAPALGTQQRHVLAVHLRLQQAVDARGGLLDEGPLLDEIQRGVQAAPERVHQPGLEGLLPAEPVRLEHEPAVHVRRRLRAEYAAHGRHQRHPELDLVEAEVPPRSAHENAIVVVHGEHHCSISS